MRHYSVSPPSPASVPFVCVCVHNALFCLQRVHLRGEGDYTQLRRQAILYVRDYHHGAHPSQGMCVCPVSLGVPTSIVFCFTMAIVLRFVCKSHKPWRPPSSIQPSSRPARACASVNGFLTGELCMRLHAVLQCCILRLRLLLEG